MITRQTIAIAAVGLMMVTAGCGFITGEEALTFSASPATVSDQAVSDAGYEEVSVTEQTVTRNFSAADQTRQVKVTNQLAQYERQVDLGPLGSKRAAVFVAFASPEVKVATETFNPIAEMSEREILQQFESEYESISVGDRIDNRTVTVLGQSTAVEKFEGTATLAGSQVEVYIHATKLKHEGDHIVAVAIHPQRLDGEEQNVITLLEGLEHSENN
ncbi:DUF6517 family protein [Haloarcula sp. JP-L23]|uniref:DUF6517 family protein n=1 Tax=Haloarcula sp. JP-L23 TaxID=2716717 RepID=UPI00140EBE02|nr:hypothetical protein G9465_18225 [Haloarcula sp. JP-L23]